MSDLNLALELSPKQAAVLDRRGQLLAAKGQLTEAISDFYAATKLSIGFAEAYYHRAQAYEAQGDTAFAKEDYKQACKLGQKAACEAAKKTAAAKAAGASAGGSPSSFKGTAPPGELKEEQAPEEGAPAPKPKPAPRVDLEACRGAIDECAEQGMAITFCVRRSRVCEKAPQAGCCPQQCLREFEMRAADDKSDAEVFREVFSVKGRCAKMLGARILDRR